MPVLATNQTQGAMGVGVSGGCVGIRGKPDFGCKGLRQREGPPAQGTTGWVVLEKDQWGRWVECFGPLLWGGDWQLPCLAKSEEKGDFPGSIWFFDAKSGGN